MQNVNEIVSRLNQGETLENIAAEFTTALNEAQKVYETEKQVAQEKQLEEDKRADLADIMDAVVAWIKKYYSNMYHEVADGMSPEEAMQTYSLILDIIVEAMDKTADSKHSTSMDPMTMMLLSSMLKGTQFESPKKAKAKSKAQTEDEALSSFLKSICF